MSSFGLRMLYLTLARRADEEAASERQRERRHSHRRRRLATDAFSMRDLEFVKTYRLTKSLVENLITELTPHIPRERRKDGLDAAAKVLITLKFYASGSCQTLAGEHGSHTVSQPSVSRAVKQVTLALNHSHVFKSHVSFPSTREARERVTSGFYTKFGFPGVIGCIDGTHVCIKKPSDHEEAYYCQKGYHSLNVMIICDSDMNILCVDPSSPGNTHDSTIWRDHPLNNHIEGLIEAGEEIFLLGDSGYPLRRHLITPLLNTEEGSPEHWFSKKHEMTRNVVERTIGVLKARFRCLLVARQLRYQPEMVAKIVNACCVLHNLANRARVTVPELTAREREDEQRLQVPQHYVEATLGPNVQAAATAFSDTAHRHNSVPSISAKQGIATETGPILVGQQNLK